MLRHNGKVSTPEHAPSTSIRVVTFPGTHWDPLGKMAVIWEMYPSTRRSPPGQSGYDFRTEIRGTGFWGSELDCLEPVSVAAAEANGFPTGYLTDCILGGDLPFQFEIDGRPVTGTVTFRIDLTSLARPAAFDPKNLRLSTAVTGETVEVLDDWFETGIAKLEAALPDRVRLRCCLNCLYSDYWPGGHGIMGMNCHRGAKAQYLAVTSKREYLTVPVTEHVPETHVCPEYTRRIKSTGYPG